MSQDVSSVSAAALKRSLNVTLLQELSAAVDGHAAAATFACGGSVPISECFAGAYDAAEEPMFPEITIRWDSSDSSVVSKLAFPLQDQDALMRLLKRCQPATFGLGGKDVLDESYRKASKLDRTEFSTDFHPHDCGIVDSILQILLPSVVRGGQGIGIGPQGVRAELYKLNIYSAPSGKFNAHVDTPRGAKQFGSLVVCLPCVHEGGVLRVKHRGRISDFDWGKADLDNIQWAAFYGDCEHEVLEVTKGIRFTLTYNLFYSDIGNLGQPVAAPTKLPFFDIVRKMLDEPKFMPKGGLLGFFCHHHYAHAQSNAHQLLPRGLKGVDLAIYAVFNALGLKAGIHPVIKNWEHTYGGMSVKVLRKMPPYAKEDPVESFLNTLGWDGDDLDSAESGVKDYESDIQEYEPEVEQANKSVIGNSLHGPTIDNDLDEGSSSKIISDFWPHRLVSRIQWMNEMKHEDFAFAGLVYGNQAEMSYKFSAAAILVDVPPSDKRVPYVTPPGSRDGEIEIQESQLY